MIAHSVGTWIGYEFLQACKVAGVPMPKIAFISAMPPPDIPVEERPWRQQRNLNEADFIEECRGWDISDVVFSAGMWPMYQPLLRGDFTIFDEYEFQHAGRCIMDVFPSSRLLVGYPHVPLCRVTALFFSCVHLLGV